MSLRRRDLIAVLLIFLASLCWSFGQQMLSPPDGDAVTVTTYTYEEQPPTATTTVIYVDGNTIASTAPSSLTPAITEPQNNEYEASSRPFGLLLSFIAGAFSIAAVFVLSQKNPILGPDGICLTLALLGFAYSASVHWEYLFLRPAVNALIRISGITGTFVVLLCIRELFGWIKMRFSLSWCLTQRTANRCRKPQLSLLVLVGGILLPLVCLVCALAMGAQSHTLCILGSLLTSIFGFLCLWKYGSALRHFQEQLQNYRHGKAITVGKGAFAQTEAQLLDVQAQHEEAVRTAVSSERFKVELISNVSHDLRTPLTSILGYSELLQQEHLSPEGQEQLRRLHQKAGYMNELVESLFELTKVSSGVVEAKKEPIDLVRLLEQTIGLFDDQLVNAGLVVRRNYGADSLPLVTDGARMHQVFANLLGNVIKYALSGTRIYLELRETERSYLIRMVNTASYEMDFHPEEILQRFARGDKARSTKGSGLGLAIAQTYTESVGGTFRISVDGDQFSAIVELPKN